MSMERTRAVVKPRHSGARIPPDVDMNVFREPRAVEGWAAGSDNAQTIRADLPAPRPCRATPLHASGSPLSGHTGHFVIVVGFLFLSISQKKGPVGLSATRYQFWYLSHLLESCKG